MIIDFFIPKQFRFSEMENLNSPALLRVRQHFFRKPDYSRYKLKVLPLKYIILLMLVPLLSYSQSEKILTLKEAITLGIANSKVLQADSARILGASARYSQSKNMQVPSLTLSA